jgi:hypothetical protein
MARSISIRIASLMWIMPAELATEQPDDAETLRFAQTSYNRSRTVMFGKGMGELCR